MIVANCPVGNADRNLWLYRLVDNQILPLDSTNLIKDLPGPLRFSSGKARVFPDEPQLGLCPNAGDKGIVLLNTFGKVLFGVYGRVHWAAKFSSGLFKYRKKIGVGEAVATASCPLAPECNPIRNSLPVERVLLRFCHYFYILFVV